MIRPGGFQAIAMGFDPPSPVCDATPSGAHDLSLLQRKVHWRKSGTLLAKGLQTRQI
jgi:hypothetical protein